MYYWHFRSKEQQWRTVVYVMVPPESISQYYNLCITNEDNWSCAGAEVCMYTEVIAHYSF